MAGQDVTLKKLRVLMQNVNGASVVAMKPTSKIFAILTSLTQPLVCFIDF